MISVKNMGDKLTKEEKGFVKDLIETGNATQAVKDNFGVEDPNYAGVKGYRLIRKDKIQNAIEPIVEEWINERERLTNELKIRDLSKERYETVMKSIDLITKNIQLLSGGKTENIGIEDNFTKEERESLLALTK